MDVANEKKIRKNVEYIIEYVNQKEKNTKETVYIASLTSDFKLENEVRQWLASKLHSVKIGTVTDEEIDIYEEYDFDFDIGLLRWNDWCKMLTNYLFPESLRTASEGLKVDGIYYLGKWAQRQLANFSKLSNEQKLSLLDTGIEYTNNNYPISKPIDWHGRTYNFYYFCKKNRIPVNAAIIMYEKGVDIKTIYDTFGRLYKNNIDVNVNELKDPAEEFLEEELDYEKLKKADDILECVWQNDNIKDKSFIISSPNTNDKPISIDSFIHIVRSEWEKLGLEIKQLSQQKNILQDQVDILQYRFTHLVKSENAILIQENAKISRINRELNERTKELKNDCHEYEKKLKELTNELESRTEQIKKLEQFSPYQSDIELHLNSIVDYMENTFTNCGIKLSNLHVRAVKNIQHNVYIYGEILYADNNIQQNLIYSPTIKFVLYDKHEHIELHSTKIVFKDEFAGFDTFEIHWYNGTDESWLTTSKIRIFATK